MSATKAVVITGTSGSGKTVITGTILAQGSIGGIRIQRPVTATDRAARPGEADGVDYHFMSSDAFAAAVHPSLDGSALYRRLRSGEDCFAIDADLGGGEFFEYALVYEQLKGLPRFSLEAVQQNGALPMPVMDIQGLRALKRMLGADNVLGMFIVPGSVEELRARLLQRNPEMASAELEIRVAEGVREWQEAEADPCVDLIVPNPDGPLELALARIEAELRRFTATPRRTR
jgi:guanylate kinase